MGFFIERIEPLDNQDNEEWKLQQLNIQFQKMATNNRCNYRLRPLESILKEYECMNEELSKILSESSNVQIEEFDLINVTKQKYFFSLDDSIFYDEPINIEFKATVKNVDKEIQSVNKFLTIIYKDVEVYKIEYELYDIDAPKGYILEYDNIFETENKDFALKIKPKDVITVNLLCYFYVSNNVIHIISLDDPYFYENAINI